MAMTGKNQMMIYHPKDGARPGAGQAGSTGAADRLTRFRQTTLSHFDARSGRRPPHQSRRRRLSPIVGRLRHWPDHLERALAASGDQIVMGWLERFREAASCTSPVMTVASVIRRPPSSSSRAPTRKRCLQSWHEREYDSSLTRSGEGIMKLPRRNFLHLAAGSAALPALQPPFRRGRGKGRVTRKRLSGPRRSGN
jgi:hypothetical protein